MAMREIIFRGKRVDNGEWIYGGWFSVDHENYIITNCDNVPVFDLWNFAEEVIPETVGQYTGLTDKHGKKIFEGDIIKERYIGVAVIAYESASFVYKKAEDLKAEWCGGTCIDDNENGFIGDWVEVIGNIHDQDIGE